MRLLREIDFKLENVARETGLRSAKDLCDTFRLVRGATPARDREAGRRAREAQPRADSGN